MATTLREHVEYLAAAYGREAGTEPARLGSARHLEAIRGAHAVVRDELEAVALASPVRVREAIAAARQNIEGYVYANRDGVRAGRRREDEGALMEQVYLGALFALAVL